MAPSILILGGVSGVARALVAYLVPEHEPARVKAIRIVDKFSIEPATTYIDAAFKRCLASELVEYKQANLAVKAQLDDVFAGDWEIVVDLTGETRYDRPELFHIQQTHLMALQLAQHAAALQHPPKAYVRLTMLYYEMKSGSGHKEGDKLLPDSARGRWWHEALRGLGVLDLNVVIVRAAAEYGRGTLGGQVVPRVVVGHVYKYLDEDMKFLYNSDLRVHTVHTADIAQVIFLAGGWASKVGRAQALAVAGEEIHWGFDQSDAWKDVPGVIPASRKVVLPLYNVVDDNDSTQDKLAKAVADVWKIKYGFHNSAIASLIAHFAKTDFAEMVEDVNEKHVEAWSKMLAASQPPIPSSPISPFLDEHAFRKMAICLDGSKARRVLGFKPAYPKLEAGELRRIVDELQADGLWPRL